MKTIPLTKGMVTIIDDEDFDIVSRFKWYAGKCGTYLYAKRDVKINKKKKSIYMHRMLLSTNDRDVKVDHMNGDTLDNRKENLRICSQKENIRNRNSIRKGNKTGLVGITKTRQGTWQSKIGFDGKTIQLGIFKSKEDAAKAYDSAAKKYFGEFCGKLNYE